MKRYSLIISTGFAMFSMFFGSGNLVFPILVGKESEGHFLLAALGIVLTGVLVPFMGVGAMMLYKGDNRSFFGSLGKLAKFWLPFIILGLMGPFGVLARCITVAHGSFKLLFPSLTLPLFSVLFCLLTFFITTNKSKIVPVLGKWLTPFLLVSLFAIAGFGYYYSAPVQIESGDWQKAFSNGIFQGYQTMDLLAGFFFSTFVIRHLETHSDGSSMTRQFIKSSLIGGGLLSVVYLLLVYLGSAYGTTLNGVAPQEMLGLIAQQALGSYSAPIVCTAVVLACFTTAVVLATLFAEFLENEVSQKKLSPLWAMAITLGIAFLVSTLDFAGIARFLGPILEAIYPALIVMTVLNVCTKIWGTKERRWPIALTLAAKLFV